MKRLFLLASCLLFFGFSSFSPYSNPPAVGGGGGAPTNAQYIVGAANAVLTNEIVASANGQSTVTAANYAVMRGLWDLYNTAQVDGLLTAYCLEAVFGDSLGTGMLLTGTDLEVSAILQKYHGVNPAADTLTLFANANFAGWKSDLDVYNLLTDFVDQAAWRVFYSNAAGDVVELALGADGEYLMSNGPAVAPTFETPVGAGDVTAAANIVDNTIVTGDGGGKGVQETGVTIIADEMAGLISLTIDPSATPTHEFHDSDSLGADKFSGSIGFNTTDTTDGAEDSDWEVTYMDAGTPTVGLKIVGGDNEIVPQIPVNMTGETIALSTVVGAIDKGGATSDEIPNGNDPDVDAAGEHSWDTDDYWFRTYDGSTQRAVVTEYNIPFSVAEPDTMDARDFMPIFTNNTGADIVILSLYCLSDDDDVDFRIEEYDADGSSNEALVKAETCDTGAGPFTNDAQDTITNATIEDGHILVLDFDDTDTPDYLHCTLWYRVNGDVN